MHRGWSIFANAKSATQPQTSQKILVYRKWRANGASHYPPEVGFSEFSTDCVIKNVPWKVSWTSTIPVPKSIWRCAAPTLVKQRETIDCFWFIFIFKKYYQHFNQHWYQSFHHISNNSWVSISCDQVKHVITVLKHVRNENNVRSSEHSRCGEGKKKKEKLNMTWKWSITGVLPLWALFSGTEERSIFSPESD